MKIIKVVVPYRDFKRVEKIVSELRGKAVETIVRTDSLFPERPDLDIIEYIFLAALPKDYEREVRHRLDKAISGTIGFYLMYESPEPKLGVKRTSKD